jgi:hypothetical protein
MKGQPISDVIGHTRGILIYQEPLTKGHFPLLDKPEITRGFPDSCGATTPTSPGHGSRAAAVSR